MSESGKSGAGGDNGEGGRDSASRPNRRDFLKATGVGATTAIAGCTGAMQDTETFKVGAIYPLSGGLAELGQDMKRLCENAVEIVNNPQDGLGPLTLAEGEGLTNHNNAQVEIVVADHRADPGQGRAEAERMVQQGDVDMLYGSYNSSVTKTVSQIAEREGVPHVNGESSSPELTERGLSWFWRTGPHDGTYTQNMFEMINGLNEQVDQPVETAAIIHEDTEYGSVSAEVQQRLCEENDIEVVAGPIAYTAETVSSFSSELQRIQQADPDVLFPSSYTKDAVMMAEELRTQNYMPPLVLAQNSGHTAAGFVDQAELSDYFCSRMDFTNDMPDTVPEMGTYLEFVTDNTDVSPSNFGALVRTWGGLLCGLTAVNQADSLEPQAIQAALNDLQMERLETGLVFGVEFDENNQNRQASGVIGQYEDAESQLTWPFDLAQDDALTYPAPGWDER